MTVKDLLQILDYFGIQDFSINEQSMETLVELLWQEIKQLKAELTEEKKKNFDMQWDNKEKDQPCHSVDLDYKYYTIQSFVKEDSGNYRIAWINEETSHRYWNLVYPHSLDLKSDMIRGRMRRDIESIMKKFTQLLKETKHELKFKVDRYGNVIRRNGDK